MTLTGTPRGDTPIYDLNGDPRGDTPIYDLNGDVRPDRVWFSRFSVLNGVSISSLFFLKQGILTFKREARTLKLVKMVQKAEFVTFFVGADA